VLERPAVQKGLAIPEPFPREEQFEAFIKATVGAGTVAKTIARHVLPLGHQVVLSNSRGPESLAADVAELGSGAAAGTAKEAAAQDLVVLAANWANVQEALFSVGDRAGRILVDASNRVASYQPAVRPMKALGPKSLWFLDPRGSGLAFAAATSGFCCRLT